MKCPEAVKKYSAMFPREIKRAVEGIDNETRYAIVSYLLQEGEASFTDIASELNIDNRSLSNHLRKLTAGGLVQRFVKAGKLRYSYYRLTPFGYNFVRSLFKSLEPEETKTVWAPVKLSPVYLTNAEERSTRSLGLPTPRKIRLTRRRVHTPSRKRKIPVRFAREKFVKERVIRKT